MALYTEESLETLRHKIDLVEVVSAHLTLKRSGSTYKGLCPFHEEKSPSFHLQRGQSHYHCFGCGAHGDAIAFLMTHLSISFVEAVERLAETFGVSLEKTQQPKGPNRPDKTQLKGVIELACRFYHTLLVHTKEGHQALRYLYKRGFDLDCIRAFRIGWAPADRAAFLRFAKGEGQREETLIAAGLCTEKGADFFSERITLPITGPLGAVIGFSARKIRKETFGGKYINTPETILFKKSHILFGLGYCRRRIAKERRAVVVEGQFDALRLIHQGLAITVAAQGTAFGEGHAKLLTDLGVSTLYLAMDGDEAGRAAAGKIGNLLMRRGVAVKIVPIPEGGDPDTFVLQEGIGALQARIERAQDYINFLVETASKGTDLSNPAEKSALIAQLTGQIRSWQEPVLVHESLRKIAQLTGVPESVIGVGASLQQSAIRRIGRIGRETVDPDRILETDLLRWLLLKPDQRLFAIAQCNISSDLLRNPICKRIYEKVKCGTCDLLALASVLESEEEQKLLVEIVQKRVNPRRSEEGFVETVRRLLNRKWMEDREQIQAKIQAGSYSEEALLDLVKAFDEIKGRPPVVVMP